ncbi:MAG: Sec-independent protein translocase protein TatA [Phycisphaerae bacterium]|nr:Sec-independent protein translocase protein TatA [Phycisphaerae bacterium]
MSWGMCIPAFLELPGGGEWLLIALIGLLIFGRRLPETARSLGRGIAAFKEGLRDARDETER